MPFVFRKIRKAKWLPSSRPTWLTEGELQADVFGDLRTSDNTLSVYIINDAKTNLERVAAAVAATADNSANVDYVLLNIDTLAKIGVETAQTLGDTPDNEVNASHIDLVKLSASKLLTLAETLSAEGEPPDRIGKKDVINLIIQNIHSGNIAREKVKFKESDSFWEKLEASSE